MPVLPGNDIHCFFTDCTVDCGKLNGTRAFAIISFISSTILVTAHLLWVIREDLLLPLIAGFGKLHMAIANAVTAFFAMLSFSIYASYFSGLDKTWNSEYQFCFALTVVAWLFLLANAVIVFFKGKGDEYTSLPDGQVAAKDGQTQSYQQI